ncbi:hypothetical protein trd_A0472 (plasmid) [Thermomicrobium roseum DSM 5159]|uniref:Uncharacterized protein n=1 Tax=Thermomicrobium roseum (strain ATCC 27502 / DSM 5159 / P-2) TaxID=309801 RepID=B9L3V8_THERP|nr:hypothetical protein trd_A0472 [Thermomicrobium roseum DSM 5159]
MGRPAVQHERPPLIARLVGRSLWPLEPRRIARPPANSGHGATRRRGPRARPVRCSGRSAPGIPRAMLDTADGGCYHTVGQLPTSRACNGSQV